MSLMDFLNAVFDFVQGLPNFALLWGPLFFFAVIVYLLWRTV